MRALAIAALLVGLGGKSAAFDQHSLCQGGACCHLASYAQAEQCVGYEATKALEDRMYSGPGFKACDYMRENQDVKWPNGAPCLFCRGRVICTDDTYNNQSEEPK